MASIDTQSVFSFFNGDRLLVITAPDHPDAPRDRRGNLPFWEIQTKSAKDEELGVRHARASVNANILRLDVFSVLYQTISSNETDRLHSEIEDWVNLVFATYQGRNANVPTA